MESWFRGSSRYLLTASFHDREILKKQQLNSNLSCTVYIHKAKYIQPTNLWESNDFISSSLMLKIVSITSRGKLDSFIASMTEAKRLIMNKKVKKKYLK